MNTITNVVDQASERSHSSRRNNLWLLVALALCVISMIGSSLIQTNGRSVDMSKIEWETTQGRHLSGYLFVPKDLAEGEKRPAIVTTHGWYNNKEMQDMNYTEFARRGYIVLAFDMFSHGNSEPIKETEIQEHATGMYDAVQYIASLPYVDTENIGITGHSNGARASNWAVDDDNDASEQLISAVYLVANDAHYKTEDGDYYNKYGSRDVGIVAAKYDEFFFRTRDEEGNALSAPRDFIEQANAQSFLHFGKDPEGLEKRIAGEFYKESIDGSEAIRVIQTPNEIHPWDTMSSQTVTGALQFFDEALGTPKDIAPTNHIFWWKFAFNLLGLVGAGLFLYQVTVLLLRSRFFSELRADTVVEPMPRPQGAPRAWFWTSLVLGQIFSLIMYVALYKPGVSTRPKDVFLQWPTYYIGLWAVSVGLFTIVLMLISWYAFGARKSGISLRERGIAIGSRKIGKTILLSLLVVAATYSLVFIADWLFTTDFRFWIIPLKAFKAEMIPLILLYLPFFCTFYVANSVAINSFNYLGDKKDEWRNLILLSVFNVLNVIVMLIIQYGYFYSTGLSFTEVNFDIRNIAGIWLFPMVVYFPAAAIFDRFVFKKTKNAWLGGLIFGIFITVISVTNTITHIGPGA